jgi:hypothetical protein
LIEEIQDISRNKDALSVQTTRVMAAVLHSVEPATSGAVDRIYLEQIVTGKGARKIDTAKGARNFLITACSSSVHARRFLGHLLTRSRLADFSVRSALVKTPCKISET